MNVDLRIPRPHSETFSTNSFVLQTDSEMVFVVDLCITLLYTGTWALPGGHLEFGETFEACAVREVLEETAITILDAKFLTATNNLLVQDDKHYVTIFMSGRMGGTQTEPKVRPYTPFLFWKDISLFHD